MSYEIVNTIHFPVPLGIKCNMMPFIQGDKNSLPDWCKSYSEIIENHYLEKGEVGFLTIDETFVKKNTSQRGYNAAGIERNVHIEVGNSKGKHWWGVPKPTWGGKLNTVLDPDTQVLIANSISDTCRVWNKLESRPTLDGDLSDYIEDYPEEEAKSLQAGELAKISIFTPHECVNQKESSFRQFFRIVGKGVHGREEYFTINPNMGKYES